MGNNNWQTVKLGDYASFVTGKLDSNAAKPDGIYPFFTCSRETFRTDTYSFDTECVLLAGNNAAGIFPIKYFVGKFDAYQRTYIIEPLDRNKLSTRFLYYALQLQLEYMKSVSTGAATKFLTKTILDGLVLDIPEYDYQRKIAAILSAYDDLIENNTRRIQILEEIAQAIYSEWFVKFQYPGHEEIPLVDSGTEFVEIPEGWAIVKLIDACAITMGQSPKSKFYNDTGEGLPFHQGVTNFGSLFPTDKVYCTIEKRIAHSGDILVSVRAPVGRINLATKKMVIGRGLCAIRSKNDCQTFTYYQLKERFREEDTMGGGTIYKSVTKDDMHNIEFLLPTQDRISAFEGITQTIIRELQVLTEKNNILFNTRDLLLPKLVSGQVDVTQLEIMV